MPRNKSKDDGGSDGGNWMQTYSDMVTLLMAFFVLLFSFATIDAKKFDRAMISLKGQLGVLSGGQSVSQQSLISGGMISDKPGQNSMQGLYNVKEKISEFLQEENLEDEVSLEMTKEGLTVRFTGKVLFDLGEAQLQPEAFSVLARIAEFIRGIDNDIVIEGHTDNLPIDNPKYPSNWELSVSRATNVVRYFIEQEALEPDRFSASGYSKYQKLYPNDTPEHRAKNRRVDIILRRKSVEDRLQEQKEESISNE